MQAGAGRSQEMVAESTRPEVCNASVKAGGFLLEYVCDDVREVIDSGAEAIDFGQKRDIPLDPLY